MTGQMDAYSDVTAGTQETALDVAALPAAATPATVTLSAGQTFELRVGHVAKRIDDVTLAMLAYNGSIPGPTLRVTQGSEVSVTVVNDTRMDTTVHWHGLRLGNRYDGVPHETQAPIPPGDRYTHRLTFPDAGVFWYHPHVREDYAQELGLYGNVIVVPADPGYWPPVDRVLVLTLDDILVENGSVPAFGSNGPNFVAMGRFGNVLLVAGETKQRLGARRGEVVRFCLTNTASTRVFKVAMPGLPVKLVGGDSGRYEREALIDDVVIAPSERVIFDVLFADAGGFELQHVRPDRTYRLADITVSDPPVQSGAARVFDVLRVNADMTAERARVAAYLDAPADKTLALVAEMHLEEPVDGDDIVYVCPMHPDVVRDQPGACPKCGMKLMVSHAAAATGPHHGEGHDGGQMATGHHDHDEVATDDDGIEWEDLMPEMNRSTTSANMRWKLVDRDTGREGPGIDWTFDVGDQVKIRLVNEMASDHPMHHPFHVHGERFLVLTRDGVPESNLVWKDTVLVRTGETVDILMDASNPGVWMAHCHIPEHMGSGMMFAFTVRRAAG